MVDGESGVVSDMIDLTEVDMSDIAAYRRDPDSALSRALKRLLTDAARPGETLAGFQSAV